MVIVKLIGGLGNQMFQYAMGRCLAKKMNTTLNLDCSAFLEYKLRKCEIMNFNIVASELSQDKLREIIKPNFSKKLKLFAKKFGVVSDVNEFKNIVETNFQYTPLTLSPNEDVYLSGYWQSEKYFKDVGNFIREEFTLKMDFNVNYHQMIEQIKNTESVAIHIRRGDYVSNPVTNSVHGVIPIKYYSEAMQYLSSKINKKLIFYIFSDDIEWVEQNFLSIDNVIIVDNRDAHSYEDIILMSYCKHNIIANSSFSWWGAWLNNYSDKIVVTPKCWFKKQDINTEDLIPAEWIKL